VGKGELFVARPVFVRPPVRIASLWVPSARVRTLTRRTNCSPLITRCVDARSIRMCHALMCTGRSRSDRTLHRRCNASAQGYMCPPWSRTRYCASLSNARVDDAHPHGLQTSQLPEGDMFSISQSEYKAMIDVCMGGRVAETLSTFLSRSPPRR
jgi:hypothetical protein